MKSLVYETPVNSSEELVARISAAVGEIQNTPEMLSNVRRSMKRRCEACITCGGLLVGGVQNNHQGYQGRVFILLEEEKKLLRAVDTRRYPRAENRVWNDQEDHEERGSKDRVARTCGPHSDSFNDTSRRRRSNCSTNNFQTEVNLKSKRPFRALSLRGVGNLSLSLYWQC
ncbi:hypothetical protein TNCV_3964561 [Trichonephila clavipes]|nr:hypothetical protein TNCV_3964561 [Trichonephila clavipes]